MEKLTFIGTVNAKQAAKMAVDQLNNARIILNTNSFSAEVLKIAELIAINHQTIKLEEELGVIGERLK